jgi:hypothetical protein
MPTVGADEECGWTRRGREPCWSRSVADSTCWVGQWLATTTTRSPCPRLAAGTYGASVLSGRPIPDERLEAFPLAELTVEEAAARTET